MNPRTLVRGFLALVATMMVTQAIGFLALIVVAGRLGPHFFGAATFALTFYVYFAIAANFGVGSLGTRDLGLDPDGQREVAGEVLTLRAVMTLLCAGAMVALAPVLATDESTRVLIVLAALALTADGLSGEWAVLGLQRPATVAIARFAGQCLYLPLIILLVDSGSAGARMYVLLTAMSLGITGATCFIIAWRQLCWPRPSTNIARLRRRFRAGAPLGLALLLGLVRLYAGTITLGYLDGTSAVGQFTAAQKLPIALVGVVDLWFMLLLPQLARVTAHSRAAIRAQVRTFLTFAACFAIPLAAGGILTGSALVARLFGEEYAATGPVLPLLTIDVALAAWNAGLAALLVARGDERGYAVSLGLGAAATVALNLLLVPAAGPAGAATAALGGQIVIAVVLVIRTRPYVGPPAVDARRLRRAGVATAAMCVAIVASTRWVGTIEQIALGSAVYVCVALALGVVRPSDLRTISPDTTTA